jgi:predicted AAA+ superfamily ATPase
MIWYERYGWETNPFESKPMPDAISGFEDIRSGLLEFIKSGDCCLLLGEVGSGKTTLLKWLERYENQDHVPIYINTSGMREEEIQQMNIDKIIRDKLNFFGKLMGKKKKVVMLIDEAQTLPAVLGDAVKRNFEEHVIKAVVMASPSADMRNLKGSLMEKVGKRRIEMRPLKADEAMGMIVKRVGYKNPFSHDGLEMIFRRSKLVPKDILENCEIIAKSSNEKNITGDFVQKYFAEDDVKAHQTDFMEKLSPLQRKIVDILKTGNYRPKEMAQKLKKPTKTVTSQLAYLGLKSGVEIMHRKGIEHPIVEKISDSMSVYKLTDEIKEILTKE